MEKRKAMGDFFYNRLESHAGRMPERIAVSDAEGNTADYRDVLCVYDSLRQFFEKIGIQPYERAAFATNSGLHMAMLQLPLMENAVLAPIDISMPPARIRFFMKLLHLDYIITDDTSGQAGAIAAEEGIGIIEFKSSRGADGLSYSFNLSSPPDSSPRGRELKKPDQIMISTTSGTTDVPKVVPLGYNAIIALTKRNCALYDISPDDIILDMNRTNRNLAINSIMYSLYQGARIILTNGFMHSTFVDLMNRNRITSFDAAPAVLESLASYMEGRKVRLDTDGLKFVRVLGAPLTPSLKKRMEKLLRTTVVENYGMTETKTITSTYKAPYGYREGSAGVSVETEIKIQDGELLVRSETVFTGYENPEIDNSEYFADGWFRTGDTGYIDEDGYLFITGRIKEMINRGGEKISPYEVEKAILGIGGVREAAVFPYPNEIGSEDAAAAVVVDEGMEIDLIRLRRLLEGTVSPFKMPSILFVVPRIPTGPNNKIQRKTLYEELTAGYPGTVSDLKGRTSAGAASNGMKDKDKGFIKKIFGGRNSRI